MVEQKIINIADNPRYENKTPELCVICHKETPYTFDTPIDQRRYYYEGVGQLCRDCYREIVEEEEYGARTNEKVEENKTAENADTGNGGAKQGFFSKLKGFRRQRERI